MIHKAAVPLVLLCLVQGCTTYQYAKNIKLVAFEDNVAQGRSVGPIRGEVCQTLIMGYPIGENVTLDRAFAQAREKNHVRYLNNVTTETSELFAVAYNKQCIAVRGTGYE